MTSRAELARQVKLALADPYKLANCLELLDKASEKQARGVIVRCPAHEDRGRANCSITRGKDGTARVKCHACGFKGDALTLVACVYGLDMREEFRTVLTTAAELSGNAALFAELKDGKPRPDRIHIPEPKPEKEPEYPDRVQEFWDSCEPISSDEQACELMSSRGFDVSRIESLGLARVLPKHCLPEWARYGHRDWRKTSNRIIVRAWDHTGVLRSVRAWRVVVGDSPKRLPPAGCKAAGLIQSDVVGWRLLRGISTPRVLFIVEGEPDFFAATLAAPGGFAVWGIGSGSWNVEHAKVASTVSCVIVATHPDSAGDRYASDILKSVKRAERWRPPKDLDEIGCELQGLMGASAKWLRVPFMLGD